MYQDLYHQGFESLQQHSDEKQVYIAKFTDYIQQYEVGSLLDIGAGNGEVAVPISEQVENYVAIERSPKYAALLREAGKKVVEHVFPAEVEGEYDLVIMSHVISHNLGNHVELVPPAWELVRPSGHLLVVTHRDVEQDDWSQLLERIELGYSEDSTATLADLIGSMYERGETDIEKVTTHLKTDNVTQMVQAMAFLAASGGRAYHSRFMQKAPQVAQILEDEYQSEDGFSFPLIHPFMSTQKPAS